MLLGRGFSWDSGQPPGECPHRPVAFEGRDRTWNVTAFENCFLMLLRKSNSELGLCAPPTGFRGGHTIGYS